MLLTDGAAVHAVPEERRYWMAFSAWLGSADITERRSDGSMTLDRP
jgi:hypothetical protein